MSDETLAAQTISVGMFKKVALAVIGLGLQTYGSRISDQQEVLSFASDILIDTFAADTVVSRARAAEESSVTTSSLQCDAAICFVNDAAMRIDASARTALAAMTEGDELRIHLAALRRLLKVTPVNTVAIRRTLADETVKRGGYIF